MVFEAVAKMIADQLKVDPSQVTRDAKLVEDLGADSANVMVLIMDLEDQYGIQVDDSAIASLKTVGDVVGYIEQKQQ
ncbi:MAG: acyl carrier protein [Clostridiales bacterium]|nr:acyl carrier protein [Clostridiales bacterium]